MKLLATGAFKFLCVSVEAASTTAFPVAIGIDGLWRIERCEQSREFIRLYL
jgi:hypothetical protein